MNQLAVTTGSAEADRLLAMASGNNAPSEQMKIPFLAVQYRPMDKQQREVRAGRFRITDTDGEYVYMKNPKIRVLGEYFQYRETDEEGHLLNKSLLMPSMFDTARDQKGGERCGRPDSKSMKRLTEDEQKAWRKKVPFVRVVRGVVTGEGEDADGNERTIDNYPFQLHLKGMNFMPLDNKVKKSLPKSKSLASLWLELSSTLEGAVWIINFKIDHDTDAPVDENIIETVKVFGMMMEQENAQIEELHDKSFLETRELDDAIDSTAEYVDPDPALEIQG